jgi:hypothetical protein
MTVLYTRQHGLSLLTRIHSDSDPMNVEEFFRPRPSWQDAEER